LIDFDPEGSDTSSTMRRYHWIATEALVKAARILDEAGETDESKAVYAAVGRGRDALVRLDAVRNGRPVPLEVLTAEELAGPPRPERDPHVAERFAWEGHDDGDFSLDRPVPHRTVLLRAQSSDRRPLLIKMMERTEQTVREVDHHRVLFAMSEVVAVPPEVTHLKLAEVLGQDWVVRLLDLDELPVLEDMTRAERGGIYHHTLGDVRVTVQCLDSTGLLFYQLCDCASHCDKREHKQARIVAATSGEARTEVVLPKESGVLEVSTRNAWSIDIAPAPSAGTNP